MRSVRFALLKTESQVENWADAGCEGGRVVLIVSNSEGCGVRLAAALESEAIPSSARNFMMGLMPPCATDGSNVLKVSCMIILTYTDRDSVHELT